MAAWSGSIAVLCRRSTQMRRTTGVLIAVTSLAVTSAKGTKNQPGELAFVPLS